MNYVYLHLLADLVSYLEYNLINNNNNNNKNIQAIVHPKKKSLCRHLLSRPSCRFKPFFCGT